MSSRSQAQPVRGGLLPALRPAASLFAQSSHILTIDNSKSTVKLVRITRSSLAGPGQRCTSCVKSKSRVQTGVVAVQLTRQHVVDVLRTAGLPEMAEEAMRDLPDPVDSEQVAAWAVPYGVNMGDLASRVGGSP
jgi:hypothetical protein